MQEAKCIGKSSMQATICPCVCVTFVPLDVRWGVCVQMQVCANVGLCKVTLVGVCLLSTSMGHYFQPQCPVAEETLSHFT